MKITCVEEIDTSKNLETCKYLSSSFFTDFDCCSRDYDCVFLQSWNLSTTLAIPSFTYKRKRMSDNYKQTRIRKEQYSNGQILKELYK